MREFQHRVDEIAKAVPENLEYTIKAIFNDDSFEDDFYYDPPKIVSDFITVNPRQSIYCKINIGRYLIRDGSEILLVLGMDNPINEEFFKLHLASLCLDATVGLSGKMCLASEEASTAMLEDLSKYVAVSPVSFERFCMLEGTKQLKYIGTSNIAISVEAFDKVGAIKAKVFYNLDRMQNFCARLQLLGYKILFT